MLMFDLSSGIRYTDNSETACIVIEIKEITFYGFR